MKVFILKNPKSKDTLKEYRFTFFPFKPHGFLPHIPDEEEVLSYPIFYHTSSKSLCMKSMKAYHRGKETPCKFCKGNKATVFYLFLAIDVKRYSSTVAAYKDTGQQPPPELAEPIWFVRKERDVMDKLIHMFRMGYFLRVKKEELSVSWSLYFTLDAERTIATVELRNINFTPAEKQTIAEVDTVDLDVRKLVKKVAANI